MQTTIYKTGEPDSLTLNREAAEQGDVEAQYNVGCMYENGDGVTQDDAEALLWYKKAAEQGHAEAQYTVGWMYDNGQGVPQDDAEALLWYKKATEQGHASAQFNVGWMYANGQGVTQDHAEAFTWYKKAAEQGHAEAQFNVGCMYDNGQGVPQDLVEAFNWYIKSAEQGYAEAQYNVGCMYAHGQGVPQDLVEALAWYKKAAEQGYAKAQYNVGVMYHKGQGVTQDLIEAASWYSKVDKQGYVTDDAYPSLFTQLLSYYRIELPIVEAMLKNGANPNLQTSDGNTAFHHFCLNYLPAIEELPEQIRYCRLFLLAGGLLGLANHDGETVKTLIEQQGIELDALTRKSVTSVLDWRGGLFYQASVRRVNTDIDIQATLKRAREAEQTPCFEESENKKIKLDN